MSCSDEEKAVKFHAFGTALRVLTESGITKDKYRWYWCISHCDHEHETFQEAVDCPDVEMPAGLEDRKGDPLIQEWHDHDDYCGCTYSVEEIDLPRQFIRQMVDDLRKGRQPEPEAIEALVDLVLIQETRIKYLTEQLESAASGRSEPE